MIDCIMSLVICGIGNVNKGSRMKEIVKPITLVLFLLVLFNQQAAAQDWEKATKSQIELANNLHQWLKIGNQKAILDAFLQSTELAKLVKHYWWWGKID
jgi:hypothetical protein